MQSSPPVVESAPDPEPTSEPEPGPPPAVLSRPRAPRGTPVTDLRPRHVSLAHQPRSRQQLMQLVVHDLNVLRQLLRIGRAANTDGELVAQRQPEDLAMLVREVVGRGKRPGEAIVIPQLGSPSVLASVDATLVRRLLHDLVDNARRRAPEGTWIVVGARRVGSLVELAVSDHGFVIRDGDKERVFEGRGRGLGFCRLAARAHGGDICVEDNDPTGARFRVTFSDA